MTLKELDAITWVKLACAKDDPFRPVLTYINVREYWVEATDGCRLHVAANEALLPVGTWGTVTPGPWAGNEYPNTSKVIPSEPPKWQWKIEPGDLEAAIGVCRAAERVAGKGKMHRRFASPHLSSLLEIPALDGTAYVRGQFMGDALAGLYSRTSHAVFIHAPGKLEPLYLWQPDLLRLGVMMPVRVGYVADGNGPAVSFRLPLVAA